MVFLGLDTGEKRIGVARSDELNLMAHPVGFIERVSDEQVVREISKFASEFQVGKIVVGLPRTMKGEVGKAAEEVLAFVEWLRGKVSLPIVTWDERLTTAQAERAMIEQDMSRARRRVKRDAMAAEIMLQSYLDFSKGREKNKDV
ncbi:MAG: Holliday junction resolvase RuvX [Candidatus Omnitrophica bacterium]|nr:Holliday junction resolvase RuvX [Candidatus Omnitrophota bacterium]